MDDEDKGVLLTRGSVEVDYAPCVAEVCNPDASSTRASPLPEEMLEKRHEMFWSASYM
jgi:hypothetical protein